MPTAGKLVAALTTALLAMVLSEQVVTVLPPGMAIGSFTYINGIAGLFFGWRFTGRRAGWGYSLSVSRAVTSNAVLVIVLLFYHSFRLMILRSMQATFSTFGDALNAGFQNMGNYGFLLLNWEFGLLFAFGSVLVGLATEFAAKRWR